MKMTDLLGGGGDGDSGWYMMCLGTETKLGERTTLFFRSIQGSHPLSHLPSVRTQDAPLLSSLSSPAKRAAGEGRKRRENKNTK